MRSFRRVLIWAFVMMMMVSMTGAQAAEIPIGGTLGPGLTVLAPPDTYRVTSALIVPHGAELVIEPGAVLRFEASTGIRVEGSLVARGVPGNEILFTSASATPAAGSWGLPPGFGDVTNGIAFVDAADAVVDLADQYVSGSAVEHAIVEYGTGVSIVRSGPLVRNNVLRFNRPFGSAVLFYNGYAPAGGGHRPLVTGNRIEDSREYGFNVQQGTIRFERNLVQRTLGTFVGGVGGTIVENTIACNGRAGSVEPGVLIAFGNPAVIAGNSFLDNLPWDVALRFDAPNHDLSHNYWGTTDAVAIAARIHDGDDQAGLARVTFDPPLVAPSAGAPMADPCPTPPVAVDDEYTMPQGGTLDVGAPGVLGNDTVPPGSSIQFFSSPFGGVTNVGDGAFSFTPSPFFTGPATIQYLIRSAAGDSSTATVRITVNPAPPPDTTPPVIRQIVADPAVLWPPNHKLVPIRLTVGVTDNTDPAPKCRIDHVSSNEPLDAGGDGSTAADWDVTGDLTLQLRAERSGQGTGRVYTIHVACRDSAGNASGGTVTVRVPHNQ